MTALYTLEQNGMAEQIITICFEMVRCMLHMSRMDKHYWGEVLMYTVHIQNLSPTSMLPGVIP